MDGAMKHTHAAQKLKEGYVLRSLPSLFKVQNISYELPPAPQDIDPRQSPGCHIP